MEGVSVNRHLGTANRGNSHRFPNAPWARMRIGLRLFRLSFLYAASSVHYNGSRLSWRGYAVQVRHWQAPVWLCSY